MSRLSLLLSSLCCHQIVLLPQQPITSSSWNFVLCVCRFATILRLQKQVVPGLGREKVRIGFRIGCETRFFTFCTVAFLGLSSLSLPSLPSFFLSILLFSHQSLHRLRFQQRTTYKISYLLLSELIQQPSPPSIIHTTITPSIINIYSLLLFSFIHTPSAHSFCSSSPLLLLSLFKLPFRHLPSPLSSPINSPLTYSTRSIHLHSHIRNQQSPPFNNYN